MNIKPLSMQRQKNIAHYEGLVLVDEPAEANYVSMKYQQSDSERSEVIIAVKCQFVIWTFCFFVQTKHIRYNMLMCVNRFLC